MYSNEFFFEYLQGIFYKLRVMVIPCEGTSYIYIDNTLVLCNMTIPESTFKNNPQKIACHIIRKGEERDECRA